MIYRTAVSAATEELRATIPTHEAEPNYTVLLYFISSHPLAINGVFLNNASTYPRPSRPPTAGECRRHEGSSLPFDAPGY